MKLIKVYPYEVLNKKNLIRMQFMMRWGCSHQQEHVQSRAPPRVRLATVARRVGRSARTPFCAWTAASAPG